MPEILRDAWRRSWKPPDRRKPWEWCESYITVDKTSAFPGKWRSSTSPWVKEIMEVFADNRVSDISCMCSAQSAKTQTIMCLLAWAISEDPGPAMWVQAAQDEAKTFARTRLMPTLEDCEPVAALFPDDRFGKSTLEINFNSMPLIINGANSQSKLQSKPIRWLLLDEVRNYPAGAYEMVLKRTRAFWNARRVTISTPGLKGDAVDRAFLEGDQRHYHVACPQCGNRAPLTWGQMKWDITDETHPSEGVWRFEVLAPTIRYECAACKHEIRDKPDVRKALAASGVWVAHNTGAPANKISFTWNAILPPWVKWRDLVEEFIKAKEAVKVGAVEPLKTFINESLGEPWEERFEEESAPLRKGEYSLGEAWESESHRFMAVDVQKDHFWGVCRGYSAAGASRLVWEGKLQTFEDIREKQTALAVKDRSTLLDSGFKTSEVYEQCCKYGWTALKGEDRRYFPHKVKDKTVQRAYSPVQRADPGIGTAEQGKRYAPLFLWSNPLVKDVLDRFKKGRAAPWLVPKDISAEYLYQIDSETKRQRHNKITGQVIWEWVRIGKRPNHLWDCECMVMVAAIIAGLVLKESFDPPEANQS